MKRFTSWSALLITIGATLLGGCASTGTVADPGLISQFAPPSVPTADETYVYVIRPSKMVGAARRAWIALNDKAVASLGSGEHVLLKLKSGINTVHMVQQLIGFGFVPVDNRAGEMVFLLMDYTAGTLKEVARDVGITELMKTSNQAPLAEPRPNTALDVQLLNPGAVLPGLMVERGQPLEPDAGSAVVTFLRPASLLKEQPFTIWSESEFICSVPGEASADVRLAPGERLFIAKSEHFTVLKADLAAGKHYFINFDVGMGWTAASVKLKPLDPAGEGSKIEKWLKLRRLQVAPEALAAASARSRIAAGLAHLSAEREKIATAAKEAPGLAASQGR